MKELHIKSTGLKKKKLEQVREVEVEEDEVEAENEFEVKPMEGILDTDEVGDFVKVKFDKFVQLMANHDFKSVMDKHANDDLILRTNLLTDLANAHTEEKKNMNWSVVFAVGIVLGIIAAYILFKFF
ncbi:MAG: hypothetical protein UT33_C0011G0127 [Candidatus Peregrinibacteria bacterium GW2011_GWC2_39_14]|nr:MAG: hypothetical protein UT33_C0011G0127 [Candidatus Peregrinibacteria bacterium GW2011_GWC2_39_14]